MILYYFLPMPSIFPTVIFPSLSYRNFALHDFLTSPNHRNQDLPLPRLLCDFSRALSFLRYACLNCFKILRSILSLMISVHESSTLLILHSSFYLIRSLRTHSTHLIWSISHRIKFFRVVLLTYDFTSLASVAEHWFV